MKRRFRKNVTYQKSIIMSFTVLYLICMVFSTYLVKERYTAEYKDAMSNKISSLIDAIDNSYFHKFSSDGSLNENYIQEVTYALSSGLSDGDKYNQWNAALYGPDGNIVARTTEYFGRQNLVYDDNNTYLYPDAMTVISPYDYFTDDEMGLILSWVSADIEAYKKESNPRTGYDLYFVYHQLTGEPVGLEVTSQQINIEKSVNENGIEMEKVQYLSDPEVIWMWSNPESEIVYSRTTDEMTNAISSSISGNFSFPYLSSGRKYYDAWKNDTLLQEFNIEDALHDKKNTYVFSSVERDTNHVSIIYPMKLADKIHNSPYGTFVELADKDGFALQINIASYPWHAAMNYMKYLYLYGAVLMFICMMKVLYITKKTYEKQEELEQMRRDFTNAAAHELKTPLTIVRGLAETMEETLSEEKKSVYRKEIIQQTEVMDQLVKEMITVSKLQSKAFILKKEQISVTEIIKEQMKRLELLIAEKNISVEYFIQEDLFVQGDKAYLDKAIFNLLENAVTYNKQNGRIIICINKNNWAIENTADLIPDNDLAHVCDLFFSSNKSRQSDLGHKGLGLYLTKRIFDMHKLKMKIENTEIGVRVKIW